MQHVLTTDGQVGFVSQQSHGGLSKGKNSQWRIWCQIIETIQRAFDEKMIIIGQGETALLLKQCASMFWQNLLNWTTKCSCICYVLRIQSIVTILFTILKKLLNQKKFDSNESSKKQTPVLRNLINWKRSENKTMDEVYESSKETQLRN